MTDNITSNNFDLTILPVRKEHHGITLRRPIHPILPDATQGACLVICSSTRSGKGSLICNLIGNSNFYKSAFSDVYVFSSTINQDQTMARLKEMYPNSCYEAFSDSKLQKIIDYQDSFAQGEAPPICIILDDIHGIKPKSNFFTLASRFRHSSIGLLVYSCQAIKMLPPVVRTNATNFLIGTNSGAQLKAMSMEWGEHFGGEDNFLYQHRKAVPERFNFLYGRLDQYPAKLYKNFETDPIYEDDF